MQEHACLLEISNEDLLRLNIYYKLLIIKISWELNMLCYILWNLNIIYANFVVFTFLFISWLVLTDLDKNHIKI